ncbi:MAG: TetR/AcrR family transcriptional regulator [Proteobacteria bacterium]|nr:TetR/AcrR family transcriptional regulator [Pseudomonadota bacterium]
MTPDENLIGPVSLRERDLIERRAEERMRRRTEILNAAEHIATARGWDALTVVSVARHARLSRALVYLYFRTKGDLLLGIRDRAVELLARQMSAAAAGEPNGCAQLRAVIGASARFAEAQGVHFESLVRGEILSLERGGRSGGDFLGSKSEPCRRVIARAIANGVVDGSLQGVTGDPKMIAAVLWRFTYGVLQLGAGRGSSPRRAATSPGPLLEPAIELIVNAVACGRAVASTAAG